MSSEPEFDVAVIGGGITGAGVFAAAAGNGLSALLVEAGAVGGQTTAASSGLVHGGLRYLPYDVGTALACCREAGSLRRRYGALLRRQVFLWPVYRGDPFGLELVESLLECYDRFAALKDGRPHVRLSAAETLALEPGLEPRGLVGAVSFDEWAVDAGGLARRIAAEGRDGGGVVWEGFRVTALPVRGGLAAAECSGPGGRSRLACARVIVNATGPWAEETARRAGCRSVRLELRKGVHWVVPGAPARHALLFPDATGRYVGLYPRDGEAWVGPTDDPFAGAPGPVAAGEAELARLREAAVRRLPGLAAGAARGVAGLRPILLQRLPGPLSRDHRVFDHAREGVFNLVTVTGGKMTTYRLMAEEALELVRRKLGRPAAPPPEPGPLWGRWVAHHPLLSPAASLALLSFHFLRHLAGAAPDRSGLERFRREYAPERAPASTRGRRASPK